MPPENIQTQTGRLPSDQVQPGRLGPTGPFPVPPRPTIGGGGTVSLNIPGTDTQKESSFLKTLFRHPIGLMTNVGEGLASLTPQVRDARRTVEENRRAVQDILQHSNLDDRNRQLLTNILEDMPVWREDVISPPSARELSADILGTALWFTPYKMIKPFAVTMKGGQLLNLMTRSTIIGGGFGTAHALSDEDLSASEVMTRGLTSALGGAAFGAGMGITGVGAVKLSQAVSKMSIPKYMEWILPVGKRFETVAGEAGKVVRDAMLCADRTFQRQMANVNYLMHTSGFNKLAKTARYDLHLMLEGVKPTTTALKPSLNAVRRILDDVAKLAIRAGVKTTVNIDPQQSTRIFNTITKNILPAKGLSAQQIKAQGGIRKVLETTRDSIVRELEQRGSPNIAKAVKVSLNINKFKTVAQYEQAVNKLFTLDPSGRITQMPFVPRLDHFPHVVPSIEQLKKPAFKNDVIRSAIDRGYFNDEQTAGRVLDSWAEYVRMGGTKKSGMAYIDWLVKSGRATNHTQARKLAMQHLIQTKTPRFGLLEYQRTLDFPFINPDPLDVIPYYVSGALKRIGEIKYYGGPENKLFMKAIDRVQKSKGYETAVEFENLINKAIGVADKYTSYERKLGATLMALNTPKLSFAQVLNTAQSVNTLLHTDAPNTMKAVANAFTHKGYIKALRTGALNENIMREIQATLGAGGANTAQKFSQQFLKYTGFTAVDRFNRIVAANAGMSYAQKTFQKLMLNPTNKALRARLLEYGINPDKALKLGRLTNDQVLMSGQITSELTQFRTRPIDMPLFYQSPYGKALFQFKHFSYNQSRFLINEFQREISTGNYSRVMRDIMVLGTVFPMTGEVIGNIRSLMSGSTRPTEPLRRYMENVMMVGGMALWGDFIDATRWGRLYEFIGGPSISTGVGMTERVGQIATGKRVPNKQDMRFFLRQTGFGTTIANYVFPTNPSERERFLDTMMQFIDEL